MWIFHSRIDAVGARKNSARQFPFDTSLTDKELFIKAYGVGLKDAATFTATIAAHGKYVSDGSINGMGAKFVLDATFAGVAKFASAGGLLTYKWAAAAWGGECCSTAGGGTPACAVVSTVNQCNEGTNKLKLF